MKRVAPSPAPTGKQFIFMDRVGGTSLSIYPYRYIDGRIGLAMSCGKIRTYNHPLVATTIAKAKREAVNYVRAYLADMGRALDALESGL